MALASGPRSPLNRAMKWHKRILLAGLLACTACAGPQRQGLARCEATPMLEEYAFLPGDGVRLPLRQWLPAGHPRAVILALHGFNDYSRAFQGLGRTLAAQGYAVLAYDQRGFGQSPARGIWAGANLRQDAGRFVAAARVAYPNSPLYLLGESMGGAVALDALAQGDVAADALNGLILVAPAVWGGETFNPIFRAPLWALAHLSPDMVLTGQGLKILPSDNIPMLMALAHDPNVIHASRADAVLGLVGMMDAGQEAAGHQPEGLPTLVLYGARDQVVPPWPVARLLEKCAAAGHACRATRYENGYHMLLRDLQGARVMTDIAAWLGDAKAALPSGEGWVAESKDEPHAPVVPQALATPAVLPDAAANNPGTAP